MKQTSSLTRSLAAAQESHAARIGGHNAGIQTAFRIYTEDRPNIHKIVAQAFNAATFIPTQGLWNGEMERSIIIEVIASLDARRTVIALAMDIADRNAQEAVLVTWQGPAGFETVTVYGDRS